jgi:molybdopterin-guanine dinucleotide biosynthesis protein A
MKHPITGIILSGGKSLRMGRNKAFIEIDGVAIIDRIYTVFENLFQETIIVTDQRDLFAYLNVKTYNDLLPHRGALGGLYTGLYFSSFPCSFCVACDMPFLKESLIEFLIDRLEDDDILVPRTEDGLQPLHAFYSKNCIGPIKKLLDKGGYKIIDVYPVVKSRTVEERDFIFLDPKRESFINVNTPDELLLVARSSPVAPAADHDPGRGEIQ